MNESAATAPGKVVVTGEYAVLAGAPALVMAVNRRAVVTLRQSGGPGWHFTSSGYAGTARHTCARLLHPEPLARDDPARLCWHVLRCLIDTSAETNLGFSIDQLPTDLEISIDTRELHWEGSKLGLGSSAAVTMALTGAIGTLIGMAVHGDDERLLSIALRAHAAAQDGRGSGLDVAAAWRGGIVRFRRTLRAIEAPAVQLPPGIAWAVLWLGRSASTTGQLERFERWRAGRQPIELAMLAGAAERVSGALRDAREFMRELRGYVQSLEALDRAAGIGMFGPSDRAFAAMARDMAAIYKPCGAGGGDVGMVFAESSGAERNGVLAPLLRRSVEQGYRVLPLEIDRHGLEIRAER